MKRNTLSVAMDAALKAWAMRSPDSNAGSTGAQINAHAQAHGISPSGLYRALINAGMIERKPAATAPSQSES